VYKFAPTKPRLLHFNPLNVLMPLIIEEKTSAGAHWAVWETTESIEEALLLAHLSEDDRLFFETILLEKRKREWLFTRILLSLIRPHESLAFRPSGQPFLAKECISISHAKNLSGIVVSPKPVGLDIEVPSAQVVKISRRFSHPLEIERAPSDEEAQKRYYTTLWSGKEAIFKCFGEHVHFAKDIIFEPFAPTDKLLKAQYKGIHGEQMFHLHRHSERGHLLIYTY
jgi:4'-phosphopantetheinyl transferase